MAAPTSEQELTQSPVSRHAFFNPMKKCICEKRWELLQALPASDIVVANATQRQQILRDTSVHGSTERRRTSWMMRIATLLERERIGCKSRLLLFSIHQKQGSRPPLLRNPHHRAGWCPLHDCVPSRALHLVDKNSNANNQKDEEKREHPDSGENRE